MSHGKQTPVFPQPSIKELRKAHKEKEKAAKAQAARLTVGTTAAAAVVADALQPPPPPPRSRQGSAVASVKAPSAVISEKEISSRSRTSSSAPVAPRGFSPVRQKGSSRGRRALCITLAFLIALGVGLGVGLGIGLKKKGSDNKITISDINSAAAINYTLSRNYTGQNFFDEWNFETITDPTHGFVNYVDRSTAFKSNLTYIKNGTAYIHADSTTNLTATNTVGRPSVRISTTDAFTHGLFMLNLTHMPVGCGTWPAFWTTSTTGWPNFGEIDVLEGVNYDPWNSMTLHTKKGCAIDNTTYVGDYTGILQSTDCYVDSPLQGSNQGCGISDRSNASFGLGLNNAKGAIFVMEWRSEWIKVWQFPHGTEPSDLLSPSPNPLSWSTRPRAFFPGLECTVDEFFSDHVIVINLALCGDWAAGSYPYSGCPGTCEEYVRYNPGGFKEAYWGINGVKVWQGPEATIKSIGSTGATD
ncbi:hypothetical protein G7K_5241-t1 [Saitoella complicata NRRL Y-17804]|uniref:GH16 domain-containing protein n=2 Tax=Saitoella complicata (strain BCRC 22490 / CBS 7301 / JCM 7358 / NBRC 10748 / NRRL Y-17804) TaxID=698492 RepID=A0A0E9NNX3_SAICN|nr:hypothetical protein G7K_5241-t1 [Saitoella complicata NRRL Y-17804]